MGERGRERRKRESRDKARAREGAKAKRRDEGKPVQTTPPRLLWKEFRAFDEHAVEWIRAGNVALTPGIVERIGGGVSMYVHAKDAEAFAIAAAMIDTDPRSVPVDRTGANVDGEFLMRAILLCRIGSLDGGDTLAGRIRDVTERCPECSAPLDKIAEHTFSFAGEITSASCARGHRWRV